MTIDQDVPARYPASSVLRLTGDIMDRPHRIVALIAISLSLAVVIACGGAEPQTGSAACDSGSCEDAPAATTKTVPCQAKAGADTDKDCAGQSGKPRKLDCNADDTETAVAAGCTPSKPGDSDVCCPLTVNGQK